MISALIAISSIVVATLIYSRTQIHLDRSYKFTRVMPQNWRPMETAYFYVPYIPLQMFKASKGFYISPGVFLREVDVSTIVPRKP